MKNILLVGAGGFLGATLRFAAYHFLRQKIPFAFPIATLTVNAVGCFLAGCIFGVLRESNWNSPGLLFVSVGFLGSFTTFSAFSLETIQILKTQQWGMALLNIASNIFLGFGAVICGLKLGSFLK